MPIELFKGSRMGKHNDEGRKEVETKKRTTGITQLDDNVDNIILCVCFG